MRLAALLTSTLIGLSIGLAPSSIAQETPYDELLAKLEAMEKELKSERNTSQPSSQASAPSVQTGARVQGIPSADIAGVSYDPGDVEYVFNYRTSQTLPEWSGGGIYLLLKDGTALVDPYGPPSDLNIAASRKGQPEQWVKSSSLGLKRSEIYPARKRGYRLDIYVERPSTSSTLTATFTDWKTLKLTKSGHFSTSRTSISTSSYGNGTSNSTVSSSNASGTSFTAASGGVVGGGAMVFNGKSSGSGNHTGTYLIDGATIELRYDNGQIVRALFGTDGVENVILGDTNYWTPK